MLEEKDPVKDKEEFTKRLNAIFDYEQIYKKHDFFLAVLCNDIEKLDLIKKDIELLDAKKQNYITQYDACKDDEERCNIVGSVKKD